ncbi:integrin beta pat-3-like [Ostrinia nubilalis]|uniref:integrin beta pat-3-like n=1 Tax=Ostrinia nubilalis TaxID=29057 RepID=UPI003082629E
MGVVVFYVLVLLARVMGQGSEADTCASHTDDCNDCIKDPSVCVWCALTQFDGARCQSSRLVSENWCLGAVQNPNNTISTDPIKNVDFSSDIGKVIQIKPQEVTLDLRAGQPQEFSFSYKPASNYPVDLYFLLDASSTMAGIKDKIEEQALNIFATMQELTTNIKLGMGTFVDKNAIPFTDILNSTNTYSFRNHLSLTDNSTQFKDTVHKPLQGYNFDEPEGGLDALAQVITCTDLIKWRTESRKLILLFTDGPFHQAGDGISAGIYKPYDGQCYMKDGVYTNELNMDYPSVSIIRKLASDQQITIIFAVHKNVDNIYSHLSEAISGSKYVTIDDGKKITTVLTDIYEEITRTIKLKVNIPSEHNDDFHITFHPDCATTKVNTLNCNVKKVEEKQFIGTITALNYFEEKTKNETEIDIIIEGINEKLTLKVNLIKDCDCPNAVVQSPLCNNAGTFTCGVCKCDEHRYGEKCACLTNSLPGEPKNPGADDNSTCIAKGDKELCSGHGSCICGSCICISDSPYVGKYCQFNSDNCPRHNDEVCNGHGKCIEEKCVCSKEWNGDACQCPSFNKRCIGSSGELCNGRGECRCGECVCDRTAAWDARENLDRHCEILPCPDCHNPQCIMLEACAKCTFSDETCPMCHNGTKITRVEFLNSTDDSSWNICPDLRVEVGCYTRYMYRYDDSVYGIELAVQTYKNCLESYYLYGGICLGSIILIGIATLVGWKWLTDAQDRREYEQFLKEHADDHEEEPQTNPNYRPASTTISNPVFRKLSVDLK